VADSLLIVALGYSIGWPALSWFGALAVALIAYIRVFGGSLKRADTALYQAKESGRDRVIAAAAFEGGEPQWSGLLRSSERDAGAAPSSASPLRGKPHAA
jgi:hypothetical protein